MSSPHLTSHILLPYSQQLCRNRLVKAPIAEQLYTTDSRVTPQLVSLYTEWGKGGYGLIVTGAILVAPPTTQLQKEQYGAYPVVSTDTLHQDGDLPGHFAKVARVAKARGALVVGQLTHLRREPTDPLPSRSSWKHDVICNYANAAVTLYRAGFDGIQLHAGTAHLLSQFLSSITNHRTDAYGGCLSNRARILFDVLREIRRIIPDRTFSISMKFDMTDIENGGITRDEMVELVRMLDSAGVDWIDISSYGSAHPTSHIRLLSHLKPCLPRIKTLLCATGSFRTSDDVSAALGVESVSLIGLGKVTIEHPRVGLRMLKE